MTYQQPDAQGHFGPTPAGLHFGGRFVAETLMHALAELEQAYETARQDAAFQAEFRHELAHFVGRPSPIYHAARLSRELGGAQIYLKREDLNHTGAHKVNNTIGQALLARRMGKPRVIAETGAGQHGVATATVCARYGLECVVYMGAEDVKRQSPNVYRMELLGAKVVPVHSGSKTLKDALNEAMRDWVTNVENTFYIIGTVAGPHPYPMMVRDFQRVIGDECLVQMPEMIGRQPDAVIACVGGGSNAMGIFYPYIPHEGVRLIGVEAAGAGPASGRHAATLSAGSPGVLHGNRTYLLQDDNGQIVETHSISAGLDYPGVGPEHAYLKDIGRAEYVGITDDEALAAFHRLCRTEGIIPALESSHAVAYAMKLAATMRPDQHLLVNLSRPRRQGHRHRGRPVGRRVLLPAVVPRAERQGWATVEVRDEPHRSHAGRAEGAGPQGADSLRHHRRPVCRRHARHHACAGGRRRRHHRARRAVQRPDGRRPGDPAGQRARAGARGIGLPQVLDAVRSFRSATPHAGGADGLRQPDRTLRPAWRRGLHRAAPRPASTACWWWTTRPRSARSSPNA
jgi:tryptophan synthase beta chain